MNFKRNKKSKIIDSIPKFDVAIIGGGLTGLTLAKSLIKKEFKTLVIDAHDLGINASLDLLNFTKLIKRFRTKNQDPKQYLSSFPERLKFINQEQNKEIVNLIKSNSFFAFEKGIPEIINEYDLKINNKTYHFKKLVFATGSYFEVPNLSNLTRDMYFTLDEILKINKHYRSIAIYGSNIQALELAYAFALLDTEVYIFDENVNPFNNFDDDLEDVLKTSFMTNKIHWCLETKIVNHTPSSDTTVRINYTSQGVEKFLDVEKIFITENRKSNVKNLKTHYPLELNDKGSIIINNTFRVKNNPTYYAIGDANGIDFHPSYALSQAITLAKILTTKKSAKFDINNKTFVIDIQPQICFYGLNKQDLDFLNIKYHEFVYDFQHELNSKLFSHKSKLKVFTNEKHEILGVFLYGDKIKEILSIFIIAANNKIKFYRLANLVLPFYLKADFIRDAAMDYELEFVGFSKRLKGRIKKDKKRE